MLMYLQWYERLTFCEYHVTEKVEMLCALLTLGITM